MQRYCRERYCACGYPIHVSTTWDGHEYQLVLRDGHAGRAGDVDRDTSAITHCPHCLRRLDMGALTWLPPPAPGVVNQPPERREEQEQGQEQERAG